MPPKSSTIAPKATAPKKQPKRQRRKDAKSEIADAAIKMYRADPARLRAEMPDLVDAIERNLRVLAPVRKSLSAQEIKRALDPNAEKSPEEVRLSELIKRFQAAGVLSPDEGIEVVDLAVNIRHRSRFYTESLLEVIEKVLGLRLMSAKSEVVCLRKGAAVHSVHQLARGVFFGLDGDGRVVTLELDPEEYQFRVKALAFIGIGADPSPDVAVNHDQYVWNDPNE